MQELSEIQSDHSALSCNYKKTLALLRALKAGTVSIDNVTMIADGWTVAEIEPPEEVEPEIPDRLPVDPSNIVRALP
ncbi:hypothetical protein LCGC14_1159280 [marine sediment metagenome]|uniref:Uncharacterized protein n=1 Tax=marine sediment metagenome TaxID=412755 RepID=A0A0F9LT62_9ZZZZ